MDLRQLRTLSEVADRGSFSAAAEALGVSQPAVSQQIRALEREIGEPLLDRGGRGARLTERGVMVHRYAQRMLALSDEFQRELADGDGELTGSLVVGSSTGLGEHVLPLLLGGFRAEHPKVTVSLRIEATSTVIDRVLARELELGVVGATRPHRALTYEPFLRDRVVLAVPAGHRFAGRTVELAELVREPLILMQVGAGVRTVIEEELRRAGVRPWSWACRSRPRRPSRPGSGSASCRSWPSSESSSGGRWQRPTSPGSTRCATLPPCGRPPSSLDAWWRRSWPGARPGWSAGSERFATGRPQGGRPAAFTSRSGRVAKFALAAAGPGRILSVEVPRQQSLDLDWIAFGNLVRVRWLHRCELPRGLCLAHLVFPPA
jgi:molybdate transport repressor ModE-like protein